MNSARWVAVGQSTDRDSSRAGAEAKAHAVADRDDAKLLIVFASPSHNLPALLAAIDPQDVPLVGCSTAGEITVSGPAQASVVVLALGGDGFAVQTALATGVSSRLREAGSEVANCLVGLPPRRHNALMLLPDGLAGNQQDILRGAYDVAGALIPLVGGCAGDELAMERTHQLFGTDVHTDAVIGVALGSDAPLGIGVRHGWRRVGEPLLVTRSEGTLVLELDDRPALDVYFERLEAPADARTDAAAFTRFALTHPLGLGRRAGEDHARFVGEADFEQRALRGTAEIPQGALAWFMEGDVDSVLGAADAACQGALEALDGHRPLGVLAFDCVARRGVLGDGTVNEVARISQACGDAPVAGFYSYGEIARTRGISGIHNQTLVVLALA